MPSKCKAGGKGKYKTSKKMTTKKPSYAGKKKK